jgi:hypothetical protein
MNVSESVYLSAVSGRQQFRSVFRRKRDECQLYRDALDRIARFQETFAEAADKQGTNMAGSALAQALANYARETLNNDANSKGDKSK